jgi:acetyltransferase
MLATLSEDALRGRFFQVVKKISHEMLIRFCNIDYEREMAIVTELKEGEKKRIIAIGRVIIEPDFRFGEFAIVVHDDFQGKGLGYKLADMLIGVAHEKGLRELYGIVLTDNTRMLRLCEKLGFHITHLPDGISKVRLALQ